MSAPPRWLRTVVVGGYQFLRLPVADQWLLAQAALTLAAMKLALRWLPLRLTQRTLAKVGRLRSPFGLGSLERSVWAVSTAGALVPGGSNCLVRALTLQTLLAQRGVVTEVRIGFAQESGRLVEGHAWLELEGHVILGDLTDLERFM